MAPKGRRTPLDLWWVAVIVIAVLMFTLNWSIATSLTVSVVTAVVLGIGHVIVRRERLSPRDGQSRSQ